MVKEGNKYTPVFSAIKRLAQAGHRTSKEELVFEFTGGRTKSLRDLDNDELAALVLKLNNIVGNPKDDAIRKGIISQFKSTGRSTRDAINWAENNGVGGIKKNFNSYTTSELMKLLKVAKKVRSDFYKAVNKRL